MWFSPVQQKNPGVPCEKPVLHSLTASANWFGERASLMPEFPRTWQVLGQPHAAELESSLFGGRVLPCLPTEVMKTFIYLYWQWLRRELVGRYRGSFLGIAWPILQPVIQILVFTLIFYKFMNMRWPAASAEIQGGSNAVMYGLNIFAGMIVFNFFAEVLSRSPTAVLAHPNLVTKVRFPLLLLPVVTVGAALVGVVIGSVLLWLVMLLMNGFSLYALLLPLYFTPILAYGLAGAWLLAGLGVYLRDIGQIMPSVISLLMFLTPIFYPASAIPESIKIVFYFNPMAWGVEVFRSLLIAGELPDTQLFLINLAVSLAGVLAARLFFNRISKGFSDVL